MGISALNEGGSDVANNQNLSATPIARHAECRICVDQTRPGAYRWIGERHWIPGIHGANWLGDDLRIAVSSLGVGEEIMLDYRGQIAGAPRIALHRSVDDVISSQGPDGWLQATGRIRWTWQPAVDPMERVERIASTLLRYLKERRGARGVILIERGTDGNVRGQLMQRGQRSTIDPAP